MPQSGGTTRLTLGKTSVVSPPITPSAAQTWSVEIDNVSPWTLTVSMPGQSNVTLGPGMAQLYYAKSGPAQLSVTPQGSSPDTGGYFVLTNWAQGADIIPGTFPVVIAPQLAGIVVTVDSQELLVDGETLTGASVSIPVAIPAGYRFLSIVWQYTNNAVSGTADADVYVFGTTTGVLYDSNGVNNIPPGAPNMVRELFYSPVEPTVDGTVDVNLDSTGGSPSDTWTVWVTAVVTSPYVLTNTDSSITTVPALGEAAAFSTSVVTAANATSPALLAAPAAGTFNRLRLLTLNGATTAASTANYAAIQGATSGMFYLGSYAQANGIWLQEPLDVPITEGLIVHNASGVAVAGAVAWRNEPIT